MRDCPVNHRINSGGETGKLIYDFNVLIDGEHRAILQRVYTGKGYELHDADLRPIVEAGLTWGTHIGRKVESQAVFEAVVTEMLEANRIPTRARMDELRAAEVIEKLRQERAEAEARRVHTIQRAAVDLYDAARAALSYIAGVEEQAGGLFPGMADLRNIIRAAVAKADGAAQ